MTTKCQIEWLARELAYSVNSHTKTINLDWGNIRIDCESHEVAECVTKLGKEYIRLLEFTQKLKKLMEVELDETRDLY